MNDPYIRTYGTNMKEIMKIDGVDTSRIISSHIIEIANILGIEAARRVIIEKLMAVIVGTGGFINPDYIRLYADYVTNTGIVTSADHYGMEKTKFIEPFQKITMSHMMLKIVLAATRGKTDHMKSIASNVITTQITEGGGTGIFKILL